MNDQTQEVTTIEDRIEGRIDKAVTGALAVSSRGGGVLITTATEAMEVAKLMSISGIAVPKHLRGNPGACLAIVIQANEWEMSSYAVANKSYSVNDRLAYESQLIQAVILRRAPIVGRFKVEYNGDGQHRRCRVWAKLRDGETVEYTSPEIATIKVKNSPLWTGDPDQQLFYYSGRALCRRHFPDVLLGVYAREELEERDPEDARDITPPRQSLSDKLDAIANGGEPVVTEAQKKEAAQADAAKAEQAKSDAIAKEKKTRKASAKAEEAAGADAGNKAGAPQSPQGDAVAPASNPEVEQRKADGEAALAGKPAGNGKMDPTPSTGGEDQSSTGSTTQTTAAAKPMTQAHRTGLQRMHADIMAKAMGRKKAQEFFDAYTHANELREGDAAYVAAESVLLAHFKRIAGEGSPADCDAALNKALAG